VAASMKGDQIRDAGLPCGDHGKQRHRRVDPLAMHEVPAASLDHGRNPGGKVIVPPARPGRDTQDWDPLNDLLPWQPPGPVGCEHGDVEAVQRGEATCNLTDVRLCPADFRKVTRADHKDAEWPLRRLIPSAAARLPGSYVTHHGLSASRPSTLA
jgi:hypothetical protein